MPGLSIKRRRSAWLKGVAAGATGVGKCRYVVLKLQQIYDRGVQHGRTNIETPYVKAVIDQMKRRRPQRKGPVTMERGRQGSFRRASGGFGREGGRMGGFRRGESGNRF